MGMKYTAAYRRFKEIDAMIREGCISKKHKKVADIAQALGVSSRTIQRDIAYMTSSEIGLPIQYNANAHTYYYTDEDLQKCSFANLLLSPKDKQVLVFARSLMLSFFYNSENYLEVCKTFDTLMERLEYTQAFIDGPMPTALLIALKNPLCHFDIYDFVHAINGDVCLWIEMMAAPDIEDICILIRPVHVIYAWSSWYLLYIDTTFSYRSEDFKILELSKVSFCHRATKKENSAIPHIEYRIEDAQKYDSSKPVYSACRIGIEHNGKNEHFEYLTIDIYGEVCIPYCMQYRRNPDNTLEAACSFHPWAKQEQHEKKILTRILDML